MTDDDNFLYDVANAGAEGRAANSLTGRGNQHRDTDGSAMWQMIGILAEFERKLISERTRAGVKAAKGRGVKFGRKRKVTPQQITRARKLIGSGEDLQNVADTFKVNRTTLYRALV